MRAFQVDSDLNSLAGKLQVLELVAKDAGGRDGRAPGAPAADQEGVSVTYQLPARTSLPSRDDQQSIQIATLDMTGEFYKLAMPVLTSYVYDQATVTNQTKIVMLSGQVQSYFNDQYVGVGTLPTVAVGEQFTVGFGIDSSLRATRELVDKTETTQGGNRVMNFSYRLAVENFGSAPAQVRLMDRLPTTKNPDVKINLVSHSKDPHHATRRPQRRRLGGSSCRHFELDPRGSRPSHGRQGQHHRLPVHPGIRQAIVDRGYGGCEEVTYYGSRESRKNSGGASR